MGDRTTIPDFKLYYKAIVKKAAGHWHKNRHTNKWNRREEKQIIPSTFSHLVFDKEAKNIMWRKHSLLNSGCWEQWLSTLKTET